MGETVSGAAEPWPTWRRLLVWFTVGIVIYFCYGVRPSNLAKPPAIDTNRPQAVEALDEPSLGIAPILVKTDFQKIV